MHERRSSHSDPQLGRLSLLNFFVDELGQRELLSEKEKAIQEAETWLLQQIEYFTELSWTIFDAVCHVLTEGIVTENGWLGKL